MRHIQCRATLETPTPLSSISRSLESALWSSFPALISTRTNLRWLHCPWQLVSLPRAILFIAVIAWMWPSSSIGTLLLLLSPSQDLQLQEASKLSVPGENPSHKVTNSKGKEKVAYPEWISALLCLSHWILLERKYIKEDKQKCKLDKKKIT